MRQRIDLDELYVKALRRAGVRLADNDLPAYALPEMCPFALAEPLGGNIVELVFK